jgi:hypothetical protein
LLREVKENRELTQGRKEVRKSILLLLLLHVHRLDYSGRFERLRREG